ncbi:hypothetical protein AYI69_g7561 [Smittium culicis]|uniref:Uncharacterized protein n=1 Tax=Smittium culicis TaxID=133412 RepID=A0A1R1XRD5_9FUNG|nr:hypothetical protein AYI69_g7561 [Smittium culicis]
MEQANEASASANFYRHFRAQDNPGIDTFVDPEIMFTSTMTALLSEVPATLTQVRLDNLHKKLDLPEAPAQLIESETKPLMDKEVLDSLIEN